VRPWDNSYQIQHSGFDVGGLVAYEVWALASFAHIDQPLFISEHELRSLGRYALRRVLGSTASGTICAAYDPEAGREVAIHLMRTLPGRVGAQARIADEALAWQALGHPRLARIHEVGTFVDAAHPSGRSVGVFVVRDLLPGMDLQRWLETLPANADAAAIDRLVDVFVLAGEGLVAAHAAGLVHRDVRPTNITVDFDGHAWLADFASPDAVPVRPGMGDESPRWPAPELRQGAEPDALADQYSFCASLSAALSRHAGLRVNRRVRDALARGMAESPGDRFASMELLLREIRRRRSGIFHAVASVLKKSRKAG
jgi:serine/threonine protein kinase